MQIKHADNSGYILKPFAINFMKQIEKLHHFSNPQKGDCWMNKALCYNDTTWILESEREESVPWIHQVSEA